jgi:predicted enzyme related to lactoylglutathione lyase
MQLPPGKLAVLQDPTGAMLAVWNGAEGDPPEVTAPAAWPAPALGMFCWDQLNTSDADGSSAFYERVFGWQREPFAASEGLSMLMRGDRRAGSVMQAPQGTFAHWLSYIVVDQLSNARARTKQLGGQVMTDHVAVPGIGAFCVIQDSLGTILALFEPV